LIAKGIPADNIFLEILDLVFVKQKRKEIEHLKASFGKVKKEAFDFEQIRKYHN